MCRGDSFVECREDVPFTDGSGDAVAIHVGPQVVVYAAKDHADLLAFEILEEFEQGLGSGVVDVGDGACIDDKAMDGRRRVRHERAYFVGKAVLVGVEQIRAEAIDDDAGFRHRAGSGGYGHPSAAGIGCEYHGVRAVAVAHMPEERQRNCEQDTLLDAEGNNGRGGGDGEIVLAGTFAANAA